MAATDKGPFTVFAAAAAAADSAALPAWQTRVAWPGDYCLLPFLLMPPFMLSSPLTCAAFE